MYTIALPSATRRNALIDFAGRRALSAARAFSHDLGMRCTRHERNLGAPTRVCRERFDDVVGDARAMRTVAGGRRIAPGHAAATVHVPERTLSRRCRRPASLFGMLRRRLAPFRTRSIESAGVWPRPERAAGRPSERPRTRSPLYSCAASRRDRARAPRELLSACERRDARVGPTTADSQLPRACRVGENHPSAARSRRHPRPPQPRSSGRNRRARCPARRLFTFRLRTGADDALVVPGLPERGHLRSGSHFRRSSSTSLASRAAPAGVPPQPQA